MNKYRSLSLTKHPLRAEQGLTLAELVVALALFALVASLGWQMFAGLQTAYERTTARQDIMRVRDDAYTRLAYDTARVVSLSDNPLTESIETQNTPAIQLQDDSLTLIITASQDPRFLVTYPYTKVRYRIHEGVLYYDRFAFMQDEAPMSESVLLPAVQNAKFVPLQNGERLLGVRFDFEEVGQGDGEQNLPLSWWFAFNASLMMGGQ